MRSHQWGGGLLEGLVGFKHGMNLLSPFLGSVGFLVKVGRDGLGQSKEKTGGWLFNDAGEKANVV